MKRVGRYFWRIINENDRSHMEKSILGSLGSVEQE